MHLIFENIFNNMYMEVFTPSEFLLVFVSGLLVGFLIAMFGTVRGQFNSGFLMTVALLPTIVSCIILVVSDNIGTGIAVAGAFSLVRFRSELGNAKTIVFVFFSMGSGLLIGVGYPFFAILFVLIMGCIYLGYLFVFGGDERVDFEHKKLIINIPEDLCENNLFSDIFAKYTKECILISAIETRAGSIYKMTYDTILIEPDKEKEMIDELRCRNGNLEISLSSLKDIYEKGL